MPIYAGSTIDVDLGIVDNVSNGDFDPGALRVVFVSPENDRYVYTYGVDSEITRSAMGHFKATVVLDAPGLWQCRVEASGSVQGAVPFSIMVEPEGVTF